MDFLSGLNPSQREAVEAIDHHLLVVAGAGSGKTRVLTRKISYLIGHCDVRPSQVLAMTFSNKAAGEMRERISHLLPAFEQPYSIGTFHSICLRILREHGQHIDLNPNFSIYDDSDQISAIKKVMGTLNIDPKKTSPKLIRFYIDQAKNETTDILPFVRDEFQLDAPSLEVVKRYQDILKKNQALDFGGMLSSTLLLLQNIPHVREGLQQKWSRILIDEYQDTNFIQKELITQLAGEKGIVCAVGDDDQSIYGWRGARVENMLDFPQDFPGGQVIKLEQNYRSTQSILEAANHVIAHNVGRRKKNLWTENGQGSLVTHYHAEDDYSEAAFVLDKIQNVLAHDKSPIHEIAIFYRTHAQSRLLEEECRRKNIPYRILGGIKFFDRKEIKDILSYMRLLINPADDISFLRVINSPTRGIGKSSIAELVDTAALYQTSLYETIPYAQGNRKAHKSLRHFHQWFESLRIEAENLDIPEAAELILDKSTYLETLENEQTIESQSRIDNIEELLRSMEEFSQTQSKVIADYLSQISLTADLDQYDENEGAIVMMTLHNSKGLEFEHVFMVGLEEGVFPHIRALEDSNPDEVEEERRLCYVGMTRAKKDLYMSSASRRHLYKNVQYNPVSRFVEEIPSTHLVQIQPPSNGSFGASSWKKKKASMSGGFDEFSQVTFEDDLPTYQVDQHSPYIKGTKVLHPKFGQGTIQKVEGQTDNLKLTIAFRVSGMKKLMVNHCALEIIES